MAFPSEEQKLVIEHFDRSLVVVAAPGTGKTKTIVARMEKLLKEDPDRDVSFITFTRSSRRDTAVKIQQTVGDKALNLANYSFPRISTLHTYAKSILHKYSTLVGYSSNFVVPIESKGELDLIFEEITNDLQISIDLRQLKKELLSYRNTGKWSPDSIVAEDKRTLIVERFKSHLKFYEAIDLQGLVILAREILIKKPNDFPKIYLQVDEYQDLNPADQELIKLISSSNESKIVVVGDDAQSIYGFRDANPTGIKTLWDSGDWTQINFKDSYRLPNHILRAAQALIKDKNYLGGKVNIPEDNGVKILTLECTSSDIQIEAIAKEIKIIKLTKKKIDNDSLNYRDFMILCPTGSIVSTVSKTLSSKYKLPTRQKEEKSIPDDHWRLLLVLRMLHYEDSLALRQWLEIIGIRQDEILKLRTEASNTSINLFTYCKKSKEKPIEELYKNLHELKESLKDIDLFKKCLLEFPYLSIDNSLFPEIGITLNKITKEINSVGSIIHLIHEKYGIYDPENEIPDEDSILVTTMHSAKGLEAEFVFILWLNYGFLPVPGRDLEEELRVFYVALTRAKQDVILTFFEQFKNYRLLKEQVMSPFLHKIRTYLDIKRVRKIDFK